MPELEERLNRIRFIVCDVDGVLTDGTIAFDADGRSWRSFHARDATALTLWHLAGGKSALVSGLGSKAVESIADMWKCCECHQWIKDKESICRQIAARHGITMDQMAFIGDDIIDVRAMQVVGLSVAVSDAAPEAKESAHMITKSPGGKGALRELVHCILEAKDKLDEVIKIYCDRKNGQQ